MDYVVHFANSSAFYWLLPALITIVLLKKFATKRAYYQYPLVGFLVKHGHNSAPTHKKFFALIRVITLALLAFLMGKPQLVDDHSTVFVDGIDIVLVLDVSGSMQFQDYDDQRSRLDVAKDEALRFVNKRVNDAIGLVIFGKDALSRVPLTLDKRIINELISSLQIGVIDPDGTVLSTAILTACQ